MRRSGTSISSVVLNFGFFIHRLMGGSSCGGFVFSTVSFVGTFTHHEIKNYRFLLLTFEYIVPIYIC